MKTNIDYYPHKSEAHRHAKFKTLRSMYGNSNEGWAAEGRFWALNNLIASADNCQLDLTKKRNMGSCADELGMSIEDFSAFISVLSGEDVDLLSEISPGIFTTETVQETYSSVYSERKRAKKKYEDSKKEVNSTTSEEKTDFSEENSETSLENLYKVKGSEVKGKEGNKKEVNEKKKLPTSPLPQTSFANTPNSKTSTSHLGFVKNLFAEHTRIRDPNLTTHVEPILKFFEQIPEHLTEIDINQCILSSFEKLSRDKGVKMDYLLENIQRNVTAKHELVLEKMKEPLLKQAKNDRILQEKQKIEEDKEYKLKKIREYMEFLDKNSELFSAFEKVELVKYFQKGDLIPAGAIIEPKMATVDLI